jgi:hypothetical protein
LHVNVVLDVSHSLRKARRLLPGCHRGVLVETEVLTGVIAAVARFRLHQRVGAVCSEEHVAR